MHAVCFAAYADSVHCAMQVFEQSDQEKISQRMLTRKAQESLVKHEAKAAKLAAQVKDVERKTESTETRQTTWESEFV